MQLGENNSALLNAVRAELLEVPDLLPIEPLPKSLNTRCETLLTVVAGCVYNFTMCRRNLTTDEWEVGDVVLQGLAFKP